MQHEKPADSWDPESSASFWINRASRALLRLQDGRLRPLGFGMSQMPVVHALKDGASLSQKELAERSGVEQPTMAELLARRAATAWSGGRPNPQDGRGSLASLTRRSLLRLPEAKAALIRGEHEAMAGFSEGEKALLLSLLRRVVRNLEA